MDRLHVSVPQLGGLIDVGKFTPYDCHKLSSSGYLIACLATPMTIVRNGTELSLIQSRNEAGTAGTWSRTFRISEQKAQSGTVKNRYILTQVNDTADELAKSSYKVKVEFGVETNASLQVQGGGNRL